jgi:biopolymer transport protein ExbD
MIRTKREKGSFISNINITPFTDVVLVLLIIFIVTMPKIEKESAVKVSLPQAAPHEELKSSPITVQITPAMDIFVNDNRVAPEGLGARIDQLHKKYGSTVLVVRADESIPYRTVVKVIDIARKAGVNTVALATREPNGVAPPR